MTRLVAIHQPNLFPWLGYFEKLARADAFVFFDSVQFPRTDGGTWLNRVRVLVGGEPRWLTVPVLRPHGQWAINETQIDESRPWRRKVLRTLELSYAKAPAFSEAYPLLSELIDNPTDRLSTYNEDAIKQLARSLGATTEFVRSSELEVEGQGVDLIVEVARAAGADAYLTPVGGDAYLTAESAHRFEAVGIELIEQEYEHPEYAQRVDPFVPGLSIIDALMNCGFDGTARLLGEGSSGPHPR